MRVVVMGPSGSGKSVVGQAIAERLGIPFIDGDDLHPAANIAKMAAGVPLDDADRMPWLDEVARTLRDAPAVVVACSALARRYRDRIRKTVPDAVFVELDVDARELSRRMRTRAHFMPPQLLASQLETWERLAPDEPGVSIANEGGVPAVAERAVARLADQSLR